MKEVECLRVCGVCRICGRFSVSPYPRRNPPPPCTLYVLQAVGTPVVLRLEVLHGPSVLVAAACGLAAVCLLLRLWCARGARGPRTVRAATTLVTLPVPPAPKAGQRPCEEYNYEVRPFFGQQELLVVARSVPHMESCAPLSSGRLLGWCRG